MNAILEKGAILNGYCNGYFGRDYGPKTVEGFGETWIVARCEQGDLRLAEFESYEDMLALVKEWTGES